MLDLVRRRGESEAGAVYVCELTDELARVALLRRRDVLRQGARLLERVEEAPIAQRHEQSGAEHAFLK